MKHKEDHLRDLSTISKIKHSIEDINLQDQCSRPEYEKNTEVIRERQCVDDAKERENTFYSDNYEKRLLYTAITRAKKYLDIYYLN